VRDLSRGRVGSRNAGNPATEEATVTTKEATENEEEADSGSKDEGKAEKAAKAAESAREGKTDKADKDESGRAAAPHWGAKVLRVFIFASLGGFLAALLFGDPLPNGLRVDFDLAASIKLGLISGALAALLRTVAYFLPLFPDD
jgi:hypothetical protein